MLNDVITALRTAKDLIVSAGPDGLRTLADGIHWFEEGCRKAADYIELVGPMIQFAPGGATPPQGATTDLAARKAALAGLKDLQKLKVEVEAELKKESPAAAPMPEGREGIVDWIKNIDPEVKKAILNAILSLIGKLLVAKPA